MDKNQELIEQFMVKDKLLGDSNYLLDIRKEIKIKENIWLIKYFLYIEENYLDICKLFGEKNINNIFLVCNRFHHIQNCFKQKFYTKCSEIQHWTDKNDNKIGCNNLIELEFNGNKLFGTCYCGLCSFREKIEKIIPTDLDIFNIESEKIFYEISWLE